ncbi:MAG: hypothetical protein KatS3mg109_0065 [Pirellulaceae bacterium]|nr:MAG: hypothetical protein KatS3mg109_0065 [Pirellulaceae bacterium]
MGKKDYLRRALSRRSGSKYAEALDISLGQPVSPGPLPGLAAIGAGAGIGGLGALGISAYANRGKKKHYLRDALLGALLGAGAGYAGMVGSRAGERSSGNFYLRGGGDGVSLDLLLDKAGVSGRANVPPELAGKVKSLLDRARAGLMVGPAPGLPFGSRVTPNSLPGGIQLPKSISDGLGLGAGVPKQAADPAVVNALLGAGAGAAGGLGLAALSGRDRESRPSYLRSALLGALVGGGLGYGGTRLLSGGVAAGSDTAAPMSGVIDKLPATPAAALSTPAAALSTPAAALSGSESALSSGGSGGGYSGYGKGIAGAGALGLTAALLYRRRAGLAGLAKGLAERASGAVSSAKQRAVGVVSSAKQRAAGAASSAKQRAVGVVSSAKQRAAGVAADVKDISRPYQEALRERIRPMVASAKELPGELSYGAKDIWRVIRGRPGMRVTEQYRSLREEIESIRKKLMNRKKRYSGKSNLSKGTQKKQLESLNQRLARLIKEREALERSHPKLLDEVF